MRIGIDFDNTIVCYDEVFYQIAYEKKLIPESLGKSKGQVRDYLRSVDQEEEWIWLQGYVYGAKMDLASPYGGFDKFIKDALAKNNNLMIISHKTLYPFRGPKYDLHQAARKWLAKQPFFSDQIETFFELVLEKKIERIKKENCDLFIDDLPELLTYGKFPKDIKKILFDPNDLHDKSDKYIKVLSWTEINEKYV